jgi:hypothetical protein
MILIKSLSRIIPLVVIVLTSLPGCEENKVIDEEKFINIYTDIIIARDTTSLSSNQESENVIINAVLKKWGATPEDYQETIKYYNQESSRWEDFFSKAIKHLEEKRKPVSD